MIKTISTDKFTKFFQGRRLSESLFESKTVAKRVIYDESVPYLQTDGVLIEIDYVIPSGYMKRQYSYLFVNIKILSDLDTFLIQTSIIDQ